MMLYAEIIAAGSDTQSINIPIGATSRTDTEAVYRKKRQHMWRRKMFSRGAGISVAASLALCSVSQIALAGRLDGGSATVNPGNAPEVWFLRNGAILNVNSGGETYNIISTGSIVHILGGVVTGSMPIAPINLRNGSSASISNADITNTLGRGLSIVNVVGQPGEDRSSVAKVVNSTIVGLGVGAGVGSDGTLTLSSTTVDSVDDGASDNEGGGNGLGLFNGTIMMADGSIARGDRNGILVAADASFDENTKLNLTVDGATVAGRSGSSIRVHVSDTFQTGGPRPEADILISNGSSLVGGNGNILEVDQYNTTNFTVDNSVLEGNVVVENGGVANILLRNNTTLTGQLDNVENLALNSGSTWKMTADGGVANLAMDGGVVKISDGDGSEFHTLTVKNLSGTGTFAIGTNLAVPEGDKLVVTGSATGHHMLYVRNTGKDPTSQNVLTVVDTNGGDASFDVTGGAIDLGVYKYHLEQTGDDWQLVSSKNADGGELTPSAETAIGLHAAAANIFYGELGTLRQRMGDVRMGKGENGLWGRTFGQGVKGNGAAGVEFDQSLWGMQIGVEQEVSLGGLPLTVGVFGGYSNSAVDLEGDSEGKIDSGYGGLYATWLGDDGLYFNGIFKVNRFSNDARVVMSDGRGASGDYHVTGVGGQIEVGKTNDLGDGWYAEPFAQLAALRIGSFDYRLDNGMDADGDAYGSLQGRIGAAFGFNHKLENGAILQPYVRVAVAQEFIDSNKLNINMVKFNNSFDGTRGEVGAGFVYQLNDALNIHADIDFSGGNGVSRNWGGNVGLRYAF